jgi:hypothetical protein
MAKQPLIVGVVALVLAHSAPAAAQRFPFERSLDVGVAPVIDVSTLRGKIDVRVGDAGRVVVAGTVTVRIGWGVPANAVDLAKKVAQHPPIEQSGNTIQLRPPSNQDENQAVTVAYDIRVPRDAQVRVVSDSGAIAVRDVAGPVEARTQSSSIDLANLGATADVETGSGAVTVDGAGGAVRITTSSSAITARSLRNGLHARTQSGRVIGSFNGQGAVDVRTQSSAIDLTGVAGALTTSTESGRTNVSGVPAGPWEVSTGSGSIDVSFDSDVNATLQASTGSGSVNASGLAAGGSVEKRRVAGSLGRGGPLVRLASRSGSIRIR